MISLEIIYIQAVLNRLGRLYLYKCNNDNQRKRCHELEKEQGDKEEIGEDIASVEMRKGLGEMMQLYFKKQKKY